MTDIQKCPICDVEFKPADLCADDIEMGTCHAKCLEGSPVVDLDTGEELPEGSKPETYLFAELDGQKPFAWYWYDSLGCLYMTGDARKPQVPADAKPLYERPAPPPQAHLVGGNQISDLAIRAFNEAIDADGYDTSYEIIEKAIRSALAYAAPRVNPLEWNDVGLGWLKAESPLGIYTVEPNGTWHFEQIGEELRFTSADAKAAQKDAEAHHVARASSLFASPSPQPNVAGDGEAAIIECLAAGKPFVFDPATNFLHADDGTVEGGIRYAPAPSQHLRVQNFETPTPPGNQIRTAECDGKDAVPVTGQLPVGVASTRSHVAPVTREEAIRFLEVAIRNWSNVQELSESEVADVMLAMTRFIASRVAPPSPQPNMREAGR